MGTTAIGAGRGSVVRRVWESDGWTPAAPPTYVPPPQPAAAHCPASARDLLPLLEQAGLAVVLLDGAGRATSATPAVERLLGPDAERAAVWRAALALLDGLRRARGPGAFAGGARPAALTQREVTTAAATYQLAVLLPGGEEAASGGAGGWGAVTIQRVAADPSEAWRRATEGLSQRERQVARLLADGRTNAEAAAALGISAHTTRHHAERVYEKLGVRSRAELGRLLAGADAAS